MRARGRKLGWGWGVFKVIHHAGCHEFEVENLTRKITKVGIMLFRYLFVGELGSVCFIMYL